MPVASMVFAGLTPSLTLDSALHRYDNLAIDATTIFAGATTPPPAESVTCRYVWSIAQYSDYARQSFIIQQVHPSTLHG